MENKQNAEFYVIFARKMPEIYMIIARKIYFPEFWGHMLPCPCRLRLCVGLSVFGLFGGLSQKRQFWRQSLLMTTIDEQESCAIAKMTAQCAIHMGALKIFGTP